LPLMRTRKHSAVPAW